MILVAYTPTPAAIALAACIRDAIRAIGWQEKEFAAAMGISIQQASRQLAAREPLNVFRLADLPAQFHAAYDARRAQLRGAAVLEPQDLSLIRGACALGQKRMSRFLQPVTVHEMDRRQQA